MKKKIMKPEGELTAKKQKKLHLTVCIAAVVIGILAFLVLSGKDQSHPSSQMAPAKPPEIASHNIQAENIRLADIEWKQEEIEEILSSLALSQKEFKETLIGISNQSTKVAEETSSLFKTHLQEIQKEIHSELSQKQHLPEDDNHVKIASLDSLDDEEKNHVTAYIPAGTIVRCLLVSAADCSVGVQQPKGPAMMLLRPLSNGELPRNVRVSLKDSVILASAVGDLANERVYVRADRMTLVQPNGDFVETEISAYVSGEDAREGVRGVVVDRSGSIIARAAFASFLQGVGQGIQAALNNQTIEKLSKVGDSQVILDVDTFRNSGIQGATTGLSKLADYYIKRAEQLQPSIQIAAGRVVDLIFTHGVKIGEKDLKRKFEMERSIAREKKLG